MSQTKLTDKKSGSGKNTLTILYKEFIENRKKDEDIASQTARKNECVQSGRDICFHT